jgi:hypothetical protein
MKTHTPTPDCQECGSSDEVVLITYGNPIVWKGFECEHCNCVVKTLWEQE